MDLSKFTSN